MILVFDTYYFEDKENAKEAVMQIFGKLIVELRNKEIENFKGISNKDSKNLFLNLKSQIFQ